MHNTLTDHRDIYNIVLDAIHQINRVKYETELSNISLDTHHLTSVELYVRLHNVKCGLMFPNELQFGLPSMHYDRCSGNIDIIECLHNRERYETNSPISKIFKITDSKNRGYL